VKRPLRLITLTLLSALLGSSTAHAAEIHVLCSNGFKAVMEDLAPQFERATSNTVRVTYGLSAELSRRIQGGEPFDLAILTPELIDGLAREGRVVADSRTTLARSPIALAMKQGAVRPDLRTDDSLRRTLLSATSIGYAREGASASHFLAVLQQLDLSEMLRSRIVALASGAAVGASVSSGVVELGVLPVSEIMPIAGIEIAGAFPKSRAGFITITAAMGARALEPAASKAFITFLADPSAQPLLVKRGMERPQ
jgi:molybdate transport system substrate-binding protein